MLAVCEGRKVAHRQCFRVRQHCKARWVVAAGEVLPQASRLAGQAARVVAGIILVTRLAVARQGQIQTQVDRVQAQILTTEVAAAGQPLLGRQLWEQAVRVMRCQALTLI
ncbi:MAG: hypothetical protein EBR82_52900 [Caulobacteraceae bacterium]|nr:hypothetical protein [Caulobacteraceae bacterium]